MVAFQRQAPDQHDDIDDVPSPAETPEVIGHEAARSELAAAAGTGRLHHAWLLQGPRGIGKASVAFDFARTLLADGAPGRMSVQDRENLFRQVAQAGHPNLLHITRPAADRGGFRTQITVDGIRRINHFFQTTAGGRWRVALIDPADDMNRNAANALLKILEEPPDRSVFLLVNHQPGRLLPTIRSRCRVLRFDGLAERDIETILAGGTDAELEARRQAAQLANGSARTAYLMLLAGGLDVTAEAERLFEGHPDWSAIQKLGDALATKGREAAFDMMTADLFRLLARETERRLERGEKARAAALAGLWQDEQARWREAAAFNLDRKQMLMTFFARLEEVRQQSADASPH